jgi:hypothetical protein
MAGWKHGVADARLGVPRWSLEAGGGGYLGRERAVLRVHFDDDQSRCEAEVLVADEENEIRRRSTRNAIYL